MSGRDVDKPPPEPDGWRTLGWSCAALAGAGILSALALTGARAAAYGHFTSGDFFRPEWWVLASFAAYPLYFASRSSWRAALPLTAIIVAQMYYIVDSAVSTMTAAGIATDADRLWYVAWILQSTAMVGAAVAGARVSVRDRRWERRMRRAVGDGPTLGADAAEGAPGSRQGHPAG
jgi:hypothetical protein